MTVKYSLIQLNTGCNPKESYEFLKKSIRKSADQGANFISTPETSNIMELRSSKLFKKISSEKEDIFIKKLMNLANQLNIWINLGSWVVKSGKNKVKDIPDLKACLDYCEDLARSWENLNFCFPT